MFGGGGWGRGRFEKGVVPILREKKHSTGFTHAPKDLRVPSGAKSKDERR